MLIYLLKKKFLEIWRKDTGLFKPKKGGGGSKLLE